MYISSPLTPSFLQLFLEMFISCARDHMGLPGFLVMSSSRSAPGMVPLRSLCLLCTFVAVINRFSRSRVSFETSFDSKQPKLEPKLISAPSETKRLFWFFRFYIETENFDVSFKPKQQEDQTKQFDREHILLFFTENLGFFRFFPFFHFFQFLLVCFEQQFVSVVSLFGYFSEYLGLFGFVTKQFCLFRLF
jgi:hypothetical protein